MSSTYKTVEFCTTCLVIPLLKLDKHEQPWLVKKVLNANILTAILQLVNDLPMHIKLFCTKAKCPCPLPAEQSTLMLWSPLVWRGHWMRWRRPEWLCPHPSGPWGTAPGDAGPIQYCMNHSCQLPCTGNWMKDSGLCFFELYNKYRQTEACLHLRPSILGDILVKNSCLLLCDNRCAI